MPFDNTPGANPIIETETKPKITYLELAALLRDKRRWPKGFHWYFGNCHNCAMGLAYRLHTGRVLDEVGVGVQWVVRSIIADQAEMTDYEFQRIFYGSSTPRPHYLVYPEHIAEAIEEWSRAYRSHRTA